MVFAFGPDPIFVCGGVESGGTGGGVEVDADQLTSLLVQLGKLLWTERVPWACWVAGNEPLKRITDTELP